ncbi:DUF2125 domain-containing protein [Paracoccus bogoriensis]|uniref:DUF2125 domain-containing protein n=1 Tax=Paracoccus bogoriensis TaxID=242065 RepID=UPI001C66EC3E|nr:DUF2125 domain-containing protein [Paracoccus bogoriensis]MBW7055345.1 DUF2125 domain-containing protein [Paracoccus bogoriensis]
MFRPIATSALALILGSGAALADLAPADVWANIERSLADSGTLVEIGNRDESAGRLVLENVALSAPPEAEGSFVMTIPRMIFEAQTSDQVRSTIEGDMTMTGRFTDPSGEESGMDLVLQMPGNETLSSGSIEDMRHVMMVPELRLTGTTTDLDGQTPLVLTMNGLQGSQAIRLRENGGNEQDFSFTAESTDLTFAAAQPEEGELPAQNVEANLRIEALALTGTSVSPGDGTSMDTDPAAALRAGMMADLSFTTGAVAGSFASDTTNDLGESEQGNGRFTAASSDFAVKLSAEGVEIAGTGTGMSVTTEDPAMGMTMSYDIAEAAMRIAMPLLASDQPQPFALRYVLDRVTLDDSLWSMFDPEGQMPRDPASLNIDVDGKLMLTSDLLDADQQMAQTPPLMPLSLNVNRIGLAAVGATAEVTGALTFGDDPTAPEGRLTGDFTGVNTLLDTLVAMGVVPQDQVMATRMMMAMFARPVDGDQNRLRTEMEFRQDGSIFANGQQVK